MSDNLYDTPTSNNKYLVLDDRHEVLNVYKSKCCQCRYYEEDELFCRPFPAGIPDEYLSGDKIHDQIDERQVGDTVFRRVMKDELTAKMHAEFLGDEVSPEELVIWEIYGAVERGTPIKAALERHGISHEEYEAGYERYFNHK